MIQDYQYGGIKMPDIRTIIQDQKLKWVKLVMNNHNAFRLYTMEQLLGVRNLKLLRCQCKKRVL